MSCSKLISLKTFHPSSFQAIRSLSSLSEIRQSSNKTKSTDIDTIKSDIVVIGDGVLANSIAYWLKATNLQNDSVLVVENEKFIQNKFNVPSSNQFTSVEGIQLSKFTNKFIRRLNSEFKLRINQDNVQSLKAFNQNDDLVEHNASIGLLQLCENIADETELIKYNKLFKQLFGSVEYAGELLNSKQLNEMFNWLNAENVRLARFYSRDDFGLSNINLNQLNDALHNKAKQLGVKYVKGELKGLKTNNKYEEDMYGVTTLKKNCNEITINKNIESNLYSLTKLNFKKLIIATPADQSKTIAHMLGLDKSYTWPVEDRSRFIYEIKCTNLKNENIPVIFDSFGIWLRKDQSNDNFYCGFNNQEKLANEDLNDVEIFSKFLWPKLTSLLPSLSKIEIVNVIQQSYDYNVIDDNGIIGKNPEIANTYWALGFNGNNEIWAPGLGRAIEELINHKRFNTINLDKFNWQRALNSSRFKQRLSN